MQSVVYCQYLSYCHGWILICGLVGTSLQNWYHSTISGHGACKVLRGLGLKVCISVRRVGQRTFQNPKDISKLISGNKNLPISESKCWSQAPLCRITIHGYRRNSKMTILQGVWRPYVRNQSLHLKSVLNWPRMVKKLEQNCNAYLLWVSAAAGLLLYIFSTVWRNELKFEDIWQVLWI